MDQPFTQEEQRIIMETLTRHEEALIRRVAEVIAETESAANAEFAAAGINFTQHSPANADYLTIFLFGKLFDRLHEGNLSMGEKILTMEAKRLGISLHVE
ncbi:MAG: nitroreductase [Pantoea sp.]|uniref:nitroreductase n=1 Tax=Pantoea TaxID=53335 RepID=UPI0028AD372B|nr:MULTISPECIES: nitroreductase [Pantoea]MDU1572333.1 nitroreductase [Pantoea sp.]